MKQSDLETYLWKAATILRGKIDAGDYKQYIFPLLFLKRICDVYDEEFDYAFTESDGDKEYALFSENHHFQVPPESHWKKIREVTVNVGAALQKAMNLIEKANPETLAGIFGDAPWTNKERLSDELLINLIEHYSKLKLSLSNVPGDQLGNAYEYLIKEFADDSGHTAAEFYTNRTVVKLMTLIMNPKSGESIYDPTCGSGGLLLNCALHLKSENKEYRTLKLYGQEINLITSSIARMNMFIHGVEEFNIVRGDTLANPAFIEKDSLKKFDIILANPPYSIKSWNQKGFTNDPYGRNIWGTPPQGCADYAFQQHIQKSLKLDNGRSITLWPHGVLFRDSETEMRRKMIEDDLVECVINLGPNLFYNSSMDSCLLITKNKKSNQRKNKILFIEASKEIKRETNMSFLDSQNINRIHNAYQNFKNETSFSRVVDKKEILKDQNARLNVQLFVKENRKEVKNFDLFFNEWEENSKLLKNSIEKILKI
ncbi:type I restriction-modification system subunit M [Candidatus Pelagibacter sp.]|nr:type I restriction-modification system subunit M [Candidatus Pelagibacter sp.]